MYPESLPGSSNIPTDVVAVVPQAYLKLTVFELSASITKPTACVGGEKVTTPDDPTAVEFDADPFV